jgi:hypothetical protein
MGFAACSLEFWAVSLCFPSQLRGLAGLGAALWESFPFPFLELGGGLAPGAVRQGACFGLENTNSCNISSRRGGSFQNRMGHYGTHAGCGECGLEWGCNISPPDSSWTPGVFCTYSYNHALRLRLEILFYLELPRSPHGFF